MSPEIGVKPSIVVLMRYEIGILKQMKMRKTSMRAKVNLMMISYQSLQRKK